MKLRRKLGNHPLSSEAMFPTAGLFGGQILGTNSNHPLSSEAMFPT